MAGYWIKFDTSTPDKPEVWAIAASLGIDPDAVVGKLLRVWTWFDDQTEKGNAPSVTKALLDRNCGVTGFCEAMILAGWLDEENGVISIPKFDRHNGETAKSRCLTAKRVAKHKSGNAKSNATGNAKGNGDSVTEALPRREEKRRDITPPTYHPSSETVSAAADKVGRLVGGGEEVRSEAVDICNRIRKSSPRLDRELVWQATWVSLALDREVIIDFLERLKTRSIQKPDSYLKKSMRTLCETNAATWEDVKRAAPPAPEPVARPRGSPVHQEAGEVVFKRA